MCPQRDTPRPSWAASHGNALPSPPPAPSWLDFFRSIERFPFLLSVFWRAKSPKWMFKSTGCFQILATEKQPCFPSAPWKNVLKLEQLSPFSLLNARGRLCFQNILFFFGQTESAPREAGVQSDTSMSGHFSFLDSGL